MCYLQKRYIGLEHNNICWKGFRKKLNTQMSLKSHIPLGHKKKEGGNVHACRDMTLHFFPPETVHENIVLG